MHIDIITLFDSFFASPLATGLVGKAIDAGAATVSTIDPRSFTTDVHKSVDDTPAGGGGGMVMTVEPLARSIAEARTHGDGSVVLLTPQGRPLVQNDLARWAAGANLTLIAGRYEGFDERVRDLVDEEISLGDFVLTGGEYAALTIVDGVVRLLPGTLGNVTSSANDSFSAGLLEHPHYTRPTDYEGTKIPDVLMSGHHKNIDAWRHEQSLRRTKVRRPELFTRLGLKTDDRLVLDGIKSERDVSIAVGGARPDDLPALLEIAVAYDLTCVHLVGLDPAAIELVPDLAVPLPDRRPKRKRRGPGPVRIVRAADKLASAPDWAAVAGRMRLVGASANPPAEGRPLERPLRGPVCIGFGNGLEAAQVGAWLPPVRQTTLANTLPLLAAIGATLERLLSEG